jgi:hypothetical protein
MTFALIEVHLKLGHVRTRLIPIRNVRLADDFIKPNLHSLAGKNNIGVIGT